MALPMISGPPPRRCQKALEMTALVSTAIGTPASVASRPRSSISAAVSVSRVIVPRARSVAAMVPSAARCFVCGADNNADGPILETRTCQYETTPDTNFVIDRHPGFDNVWLVGGGSGHGFKHSAAIGEALADLAINGKHGASKFDLSKFGMPV